MSRNIPTFLIPGNPLSPAVVSGKAVTAKASESRSSSVQNAEETQPHAFQRALNKALKPVSAKNSTQRADKTVSKKQVNGTKAQSDKMSETETTTDLAFATTTKLQKMSAGKLLPSVPSELESASLSQSSDGQLSGEQDVASMGLSGLDVLEMSPAPATTSTELLLQAMTLSLPGNQSGLVQAAHSEPGDRIPSILESLQSLENLQSGVDALPVVTSAVSIPMDTLTTTSPLNSFVSPATLSPAALHASLAQPGVASLNKATGEAATSKQTDSSSSVTTSLDAAAAMQALTPMLLAGLPTTGGTLSTDATSIPADKNASLVAESIHSNVTPADSTASLHPVPQHSKMANPVNESPEAFTIPTVLSDVIPVSPEIPAVNPADVNQNPASALSSMMDTSDALPVGLFAEASLFASNGLSTTGLPQGAIGGTDVANANPLEAIADKAANVSKVAPAASTSSNATSVKAASIFANAQASTESKSANGSLKSLSEMDLDEGALDSLTVESSVTALPTPLELASGNVSVATTVSGTEANQSSLPPAFTSTAAHPADQVLEGAAYGVKNGHRELIIRLNPDNLGEVRVTLSSQDGGGLSARLVASTPESHALLSSQAESLKTSLEAQGVRVDRLNVVLAGQVDSLQEPAALAAGSNFHTASDNGSSDHHSAFHQFSQESFSQDNNAFSSSMNGQSSDEGAAARQAAMNDNGAFQQRQNGYATNPATGLKQPAALFDGEAALADTVSTSSSGRSASNHSGQVSVLA